MRDVDGNPPARSERKRLADWRNKIVELKGLHTEVLESATANRRASCGDAAGTRS